MPCLFNTRVNSEIILSYLGSDTDLMMKCMPPWNPWNVGKELATCPTQWLIDAFDMADGTEPIIGYNGTEPIINPESGYDEQNPYANRDPRLQQIVLYHGNTWPLVNGSQQTLDITKPENMGSGYFLLKWSDNRIDYRKNGKSQQNFIMMQLCGSSFELCRSNQRNRRYSKRKIFCCGCFESDTSTGRHHYRPGS